MPWKREEVAHDDANCELAVISRNHDTRSILSPSRGTDGERVDQSRAQETLAVTIFEGAVIHSLVDYEQYLWLPDEQDPCS
jgi:hypothetical protein